MNRAILEHKAKWLPVLITDHPIYSGCILLPNRKGNCLSIPDSPPRTITDEERDEILNYKKGNTNE